jgi:hypothetical protein
MSETALRTAAGHAAIGDLAARGYHVTGGVDPAAAATLLARIRATRAFDQGLFLSQTAFDADPQYTGVNPRPGRNLLDALAADAAFVEADAGLTRTLAALLGEDCQLLNRKIVCGVPASAVPDWLKARIEGNPVNNLGAWVRPEYRDITYFYGIDFHQDLIDFPEREADFVTLYVYLHEVGTHDAPLFLLEGSHRFGGSLFPHDLSRNEDGWRYADGRGQEMTCRQHRLTGPAGYAALWHGCTLHGTQPDAADAARLSLRYLYAKAPGAKAGIDAVNAGLKGPLSLTATRRDLDGRGAAVVKGNAVKAA